MSSDIFFWLLMCAFMWVIAWGLWPGRWDIKANDGDDRMPPARKSKKLP
jgi:hypothetical protein